MLNLESFKLIKISDKETFLNFYKKYPPSHSDYSFVTMVSWQHYMKYYYTFLEDSLIILTKCKDKIQVRPPQGKSSLDVYKKVIDFALRECDDPPLGMIDKDAKKIISESFQKFYIEPDRDFFDYVYFAQDLADLPGKKYIKMRNLTNRFRKRYRYEIEPISETNIEDVEKFLRRWCLWKDCDKIPLLESEKRAVLFCMDNFFDLDISGIAIRIDNNIEAASIIESLDNENAVIHFEKAISDFEGLYQIINQEAAKILQKNYRFINRESDMGFAGLRLAKEKYHPHHMVEVYHINKEELKKLTKH